MAADLNVSRETLEKLEAYEGLLRRWQPTVNLVGTRSLHDLWRRHFLDSGQLLQHLPESYGALYDIGSGAGFPGLVLSLLGARSVSLVEADQRKAAFLREAIRITGAAATVYTARIESLAPPPGTAGQRLVLTARAVAPLESLLRLAGRMIDPGTVCLFLKGAEVGPEIELARRNWLMRLESLPSMSDARGVILRIDELAHV